LYTNCSYGNTPLNYYSVEKIVEKIQTHVFLNQILLKKKIAISSQLQEITAGPESLKKYLRM